MKPAVSVDERVKPNKHQLICIGDLVKTLIKQENKTQKTKQTNKQNTKNKQNKTKQTKKQNKSKNKKQTKTKSKTITIQEHLILFCALNISVITYQWEDGDIKYKKYFNTPKNTGASKL